jgi:hypothetical protein
MELSLEIAQLTIHDVQLVVIFLERAADPRAYAALKSAASQAGLVGHIVAVWPDEFGRTRFFARPEQHAFFRVTGYDQLRAQINGHLRCSLS